MRFPIILTSIFLFLLPSSSNAVNVLSEDLVIPADLKVNIEIVNFNANRVCADLVGIEYEAVEFSSRDWDKYQDCMAYFRKVNGVVD